MTDLSKTVSPKSDQLNSDDLMSGPRTITITRVTANEGAPEQPINIYFEGDDGKPYRPCKSMRRALIHVWGSDGSAYVGRSMTLFRDPTVTFGKIAVGGTRISHMSHIDRPSTMALTASRTSRKPYTVQPLKIHDATKNSNIKAGRDLRKVADNMIAAMDSADNFDLWSERRNGDRFKADEAFLGKESTDLMKEVKAAIDKAQKRLEQRPQEEAEY